ncbi:MAG: helix-turn-helix domain-containing protein [Balneolaceae bacterium]
MISLENIPQDPAVSLHIDRYQLYYFSKPAYLKTVPNGKFDIYFILDGSFSVLDQSDGTFKKAPKTGLFFASNDSSLLRIDAGMKCINIKMKISVLGHPEFKLPKTDKLLVPFFFPYSPEVRQEMTKRLTAGQEGFETEWLDALFKKILSPIPNEGKILQVLEEFTDLKNEDIESISRSLYMTTKSLYRFVKKHFSLTPKQLKDVIRFDLTTSHLMKNPSTNLVEALSFGYYDQSHFVKECRKITGMSPKKFFSGLHFTTNDLIQEHINNS